MQATHVRVFKNDTHRIYHGEALEVLNSEIPDGSVDLIFADPPYNIGKRFVDFEDKWPSDAEYAKWCEKWLNACISKLKANGSLYIMTSTQCMPYLDIYLRDRLSILARIVWHYDSSGVQAKKKFGSMYEPILFCVKDEGNYTFNGADIKVEARTGATRKLIDYRKPQPTQYNTTKIPGNVWPFPRVRYRMPEYEEHPSQKPEALLERIIKVSSNPGDVILDPFSGTFTTGAVAKRLGRQSIGIERELQYIKIGLRRLGICSELDGELLKALDKSYVRRNSLSSRFTDNQQSLFEE
ncbi:MAG: DNA adenine methyltransferase YhdJ [Verrucomicrobia subdivision 3 bacterium]|nr:DNA adenine methyltransferase YhdJ [Limisphaerales bacterium]MCS1415779.1 DNA adenine methyltransferase YhdJ [Limisphaerales bacterium]